MFDLNLTSKFPGREKSPVSLVSATCTSGGVLLELKQPKGRADGVRPPLDDLSIAEKRVWTLISEHQQRVGSLPSLGDLTRILRCGKETAKAIRARFRRELDRQHGQAVLLIYSQQNTKRFARNVSQETLKAIDNANGFLFSHHLKNLWLLTVVVPSDSELTHCAICDLSKEIPVQLVAQLLPHVEVELYTFRWEMRKDRRLHLHLFAVLPEKDRRHQAEVRKRLRYVWHRVLDDLVDEKTRCGPFINSNGASGRKSEESWVDATYYAVMPDLERYAVSYTAQTYKKSKGRGLEKKFNNPARKISLLDNRLIAPRFHGGVSPKLRQLTESEKREVWFPIFSETEREILQQSLLKRINGGQWRESQCRYARGGWCRISIENIQTTKQLIEDLAVDYPASLSDDAPFRMSLRLTANRRLSIYTTRNRKLKTTRAA